MLMLHVTMLQHMRWGRRLLLCLNRRRITIHRIVVTAVYVIDQ
jgi:hypothetical protein